MCRTKGAKNKVRKFKVGDVIRARLTEDCVTRGKDYLVAFSDRGGFAILSDDNASSYYSHNYAYDGDEGLFELVKPARKPRQPKYSATQMFIATVLTYYIGIAVGYWLTR